MSAAFNAIFPIVILLVCLPFSIDLGVRHISPIYAPLAVLGGYAAARLVKDRRWRASWRSRLSPPDYMAYFNPIASAHPENILCESDLEWGRILFRLAARLRFLGVSRVLWYYSACGLTFRRTNLRPFRLPAKATRIARVYYARGGLEIGLQIKGLDFLVLFIA